MNDNLIWKVYTENNNKIVEFNIFDHGSFFDDTIRNCKKFKNDFDKFSEAIRHDLHYYFWSRSQYEVYVTPICTNNNTKTMKIDVYDQVTLNWDSFINYLWTKCHERKKPIRKPKETN